MVLLVLYSLKGNVTHRWQTIESEVYFQPVLTGIEKAVGHIRHSSWMQVSEDTDSDANNKNGQEGQEDKDTGPQQGTSVLLRGQLTPT